MVVNHSSDLRKLVKKIYSKTGINCIQSIEMYRIDGINTIILKIKYFYDIRGCEMLLKMFPSC